MIFERSLISMIESGEQMAMLSATAPVVDHASASSGKLEVSGFSTGSCCDSGVPLFTSWVSGSFSIGTGEGASVWTEGVSSTTGISACKAVEGWSVFNILAASTRKQAPSKPPKVNTINKTEQNLSVVVKVTRSQVQSKRILLYSIIPFP